MSVSLLAFRNSRVMTVLVVVSCLLSSVDCAAQSGDLQPTLSEEVRAAILDGQFFYNPQSFGQGATAPSLTAEDCIRNYGPDLFRVALLELLRDPESKVREAAANAALYYGLPAGHLDGAIETMLNDTYHDVNLVGLRMASDARRSPLLVVRIALAADHSFRQEAIQSLRAFVCRQPVDCTGSDGNGIGCGL